KDLPRSRLGVDVANGFAPRYIVIKGKAPILKELKEAAKQASSVYMATDPDREGEAISWHLSDALRAVNPAIKRIEFPEITRDGVRYGAPTDEGATVIRTRDQADAIVASLRGVPFTVGEVRRKDQFRHPSPPFTTSTLQQEANHRLGYSAARTMNVAQQLYEGVDLGAEGTVGLITYMRTDSVRVAESAQREAQEYVKKAFGASYLPDAPRVYRSRRSAQDAHEAIRPTSVQRTPDRVKPYLRSDQFKVYKLIWKRFLSSQTASAVIDTLSVDIAAGAYPLRATGSRVKFPGFLAVYRDLPENGEGQEGWLPDLTAGET